MKRFHVHVSVNDLQESIRFYSTVFGAPPTVEKPDYAKWMVEDPRLNFAISRRERGTGVNHLGIQVDSDEELRALRAQVAEAKLAVHDERGVSCCYSVSDKHWVTDPQGVAWETYRTLGEAPTFSGEAGPDAAAAGCCAPEADSACCAPAAAGDRARCCA